MPKELSREQWRKLVGDEGLQTMDNMIANQSFDNTLQSLALNYQINPSIFANYKNMLQQQVYGSQQRDMQNVLNQFATTGGRFGNVQTAAGMVGGQYATALSQALSNLAARLQQQELDTRMKYLQAYIQKYGIDRNAQVALQQLAAAENAAMWQGIGKLFGDAGSFVVGGLTGMF